MQVECIAQTAFFPPGDVPWQPDCATDESTGVFNGSQLVEFAGRACYQSWKRPNPLTATNEGYLKHVIEVGHFSVLEHATVSFYVQGISRSLTHEQVRHRHFNYSQLSQRYVPAKAGPNTFVEPDVIAEDDKLHAMFVDATEAALDHYLEIKMALEEKFVDLDDGTAKRKASRQAARSVLPNATETKLVITGNYRSWWNYLLLRATPQADPEIRELSIMFLRQLQQIAPGVFNHFSTYTLDDGTEAATTEYDDEEFANT